MSYIEGTGDQIILEEIKDHDYSPTQDEIFEYAQLIGIDPVKEPEFLSIARSGLTANLPEHWRPCENSKGELYYFNFQTGESQWDHPMDQHLQKLVIAERWRKSACLETIDSVSKKSENYDSPIESVKNNILAKNVDNSQLWHILPSDFDDDEVNGSESSENKDSGCSSKEDDVPAPKISSTSSADLYANSNGVLNNNGNTSYIPNVHRGSANSSSLLKSPLLKKSNSRFVSPPQSNISDFNYNIVFGEHADDHKILQIPIEPNAEIPIVYTQQGLRSIRYKQLERIAHNDIGLVNKNESDVDNLKENESIESESSVDTGKNISVINRPSILSDEKYLKIIRVNRGASCNTFKTFPNNQSEKQDIATGVEIIAKDKEINKLKDEIERLKIILGHKDQEIENLKEQLVKSEKVNVKEAFSKSFSKGLSSSGNISNELDESKFSRFAVGYTSLKNTWRMRQRISNDLSWASDSSSPTMGDRLDRTKRRLRRRKMHKSMFLPNAINTSTPNYQTHDFITFKSSRNHLSNPFMREYLNDHN